MKVHLTYFQKSGKYYSEGELEYPDLPFHTIVEHVGALLDAGVRPGLMEGPRHFHTVAEVFMPDGPQAFMVPALENEAESC